MLFRVILKPLHDVSAQTYTTHIICTSCGHRTIGATFKTKSLLSMSKTKCICGKTLGNQDLLNKKIEARIEYHKNR